MKSKRESLGRERYLFSWDPSFSAERINGSSRGFSNSSFSWGEMPCIWIEKGLRLGERGHTRSSLSSKSLLSERGELIGWNSIFEIRLLIIRIVDKNAFKQAVPVARVNSPWPWHRIGDCGLLVLSWRSHRILSFILVSFIYLLCSLCDIWLPEILENSEAFLGKIWETDPTKDCYNHKKLVL